MRASALFCGEDPHSGIPRSSQQLILAHLEFSGIKIFASTAYLILFKKNHSFCFGEHYVLLLVGALGIARMAELFRIAQKDYDLRRNHAPEIKHIVNQTEVLAGKHDGG